MMIYVEFQLEGRVRMYQIADVDLLRKARIEARAAFLPVPETLDQVHDYLRANCFQLEMFETSDHLVHWAERYAGFRAGEARAELARYLTRRAAMLITGGGDLILVDRVEGAA